MGAVVAIYTLAGCSASTKRGFLPEGVTTDADRITNLWNGAWVAALVVGVLVWGLILWCVVAFRKRKNDSELPVQLRYNVPIEILYTVIPLFMVGVLFYYTARDEAVLERVSNPNQVNVVHVVGKRWAWDFNYLSSDTYESTAQVPISGDDLGQEQIPTLYLPVNRPTQFVLTSRDVIHSFWVPAFLRKTDMISGRVNIFEVTPDKVGTYAGKCAELCGSYHSQMIFQVKVVPESEYEKHMADLEEKGQTGSLSDSLNLEQLAPGEREKIPTLVRN